MYWSSTASSAELHTALPARMLAVNQGGIIVEAAGANRN